VQQEATDEPVSSGVARCLGFRTEEPMAHDLCGRTLGAFVLGEKLADGGCGTLYRCQQPSLKRAAVVKVLREQQRDDKETKEAQERFLREAQLASQLDHPYAAHVYDYGVESDGLRWIAMELVPGETLDQRLIDHGRMSLEQFVPMFECLAEVVHHAHELRIVHRDVKAANVMVIERRGRLIPKLLDFGIAKTRQEDAPATSGSSPDGSFDENHDPARVAAASGESTETDPSAKDRLTPSRAGIGSSAYMAPEQWEDTRTVGAASDIYSLGVLAYKALAGRVPFTAQSRHEWRHQHLHAKVPPLGDDLPAILDPIFQRALAKAPGDRHSTALELAAELRAVLIASERELLRSLAQQWDACARPYELLLSGGVLAGVERWQRDAPSGVLSELECSYVAASQRRARRSARIRRSLLAAAAVIALGVPLGAVVYHSVLQTHMAEDLVTQAEVERGQQALIHGESSEAVRHLEHAYQRGDHSPGVVFMLARALQPRVSELGRLTSTSGRMWSAMFSPDDKRIVTSDDMGARMWDAGSSQLLFTMAHNDSVYHALFSPDGSRIATAGGDGTVRIWSAATGAPVRVLTSQRPSVKQWRAVAMSSHYVAAVEMKGRVAQVWDAETGTTIAELNNGGGEVASLAFSTDGRWLATSGDEGVRAFDTSTWTQAIMITAPRVRSISFDSASSRLAVGTYDGEASIWEIPSGVRLRHLRQAGESVDAIAFSPNGELVAAGSREGAAHVWDVTTGALRAQLYAHRGEIYAVEFSPNGDLLLSAGAVGSVVLANVATGSLASRLEGPENLVRTAHFDSGARRVVGASLDGTARVWDATAPYRRWELPPIGAECDTAESLVPDQRFIVLSCRNHGTHVWDTTRGELIARLPDVTTVEGDYYSALPAITATGDRAAIARGNTVEIYALPSGQLLRTITHPAAVNAVAFASASRDLISGDVDGSILITRDDRDPIALPPSRAGIDAVAILEDGRAVVADANNRLRVIEVGRHAPLMDLTAPSRMRLLRPSPDGTRLVTISIRNKQAAPVLWDLAQYRLLAQLDGHVHRVFTARFVAGGHEFLTAGRDGVRLWNATTGSLRQSFRGDSSFLADATMAPDGSLVVAGGSDGLLRFWDVSNGRLLWKLQAHKSYVVGVHYEGGEIVTRGFAGDISRWALPLANSVIDACHASACTGAEK
jgi:WD40 repeat protein/serine/threonine protein kinase